MTIPVSGAEIHGSQLGEPGSSGASSPPTVICVLGTHRSGTSVVARLLNVLGVHLGPEDHLLKADAHNPRGYWENERLYKLNKEILARFGRDWREPPCFPPGWGSSPALADIRRRASAAIVEEFGGASVWGWKDPRTCLTLPFWQHLLPPMRYAICLRNPVSVARSLERRNSDFPLERGLYLWLAYLKSALACTSGAPRVFVFYEDLLDDWRRELRRLSSFLDEPGRAEKKEIQDEVQAFISKDLQHHPAAAAVEVELDRPDLAAALGIARRAYETLQEERREVTDCLDTHAPEQAIQEGLELLGPELRRWKRLKPTWMQLQDAAREELMALIPPGDPWILLDQEQCELDLSARVRLPFLERNGRSPGLPANDDEAIGGLERLRASGASHLAFAWPAFWWLRYYTGLHGHLRSRFPCVLENDRLVVFDLRKTQG